MEVGTLRVTIIQQATSFQVLNHIKGSDAQMAKLHSYAEDMVGQMAKGFDLNKDQMVNDYSINVLLI